jgi:hypothetical protein
MYVYFLIHHHITTDSLFNQFIPDSYCFNLLHVNFVHQGFFLEKCNNVIILFRDCVVKLALQALARCFRPSQHIFGVILLPFAMEVLQCFHQQIPKVLSKLKTNEFKRSDSHQTKEYMAMG